MDSQLQAAEEALQRLAPEAWRRSVFFFFGSNMRLLMAATLNRGSRPLLWISLEVLEVQRILVKNHLPSRRCRDLQRQAASSCFGSWLEIGTVNCCFGKGSNYISFIVMQSRLNNLNVNAGSIVPIARLEQAVN